MSEVGASRTTDGPGRRSTEPAEAHVLVIEDNVNNHAALMRLLYLAGVPTGQCECRYNGVGAIQFAASSPEPIDLILLDLGLPYQDGYEVLAQLRAEPHFRDTRIVAVTGHTAIEEMRRAQAAGFDGFLGKPLLPERFPGQLTRILAGEPVWEPR